MILRSLVLLLLVSSLSAFADDDPRDFVADRPGATDNPLTQHTGTYRLEVGVFDYSDVKAGPITARERDYGSLTLVGGISDHMELQLRQDSYEIDDYNDETGHARQEAIGLSQIRLKWNLAGNSGGPAVALIPNLVYGGKLGASQISGGFGVPIAFDVAPGWNLGLMPQWDYIRLSPSLGFSQYQFVVLMNHDFSETFSAYVQYVEYGDDYHHLNSGQGLGFAYKLAPKTQVDAGVSWGNDGGVKDKELSTGLVFGF